MVRLFPKQKLIFTWFFTKWSGKCGITSNNILTNVLQQGVPSFHRHLPGSCGVVLRCELGQHRRTS